MSSGFFDVIIQDVIILVNAEFRKLRLKTINRDSLLLFFDDATAGMNISINLVDSKKKLLNKRLVKIAQEIAEKHSIQGFTLVID